MQNLLIAAISFHVLAAIFWAGSTFVLARTGGKGATQLLRPQLGAAAVAFLSGGYLWHALHDGSFGTAEKVLGLGIGCAVIALLLQSLLAIGMRGKPGDGDAAALDRSAATERAAAVLLVVTVICMAASRYA
jgi:hypothetical protein